MTYAVVTVEKPKNDTPTEYNWGEVLGRISSLAKLEKDEIRPNGRLGDNRWLLTLESDFLLLSAMVIAASEYNLPYTVEIIQLSVGQQTLVISSTKK